ncbi:MAG: nucleotidyltransferase [Bdellovibrionales bacterium]|nr:nucleotidyltransferase [Bdellovibrionales bacterium]
METLIDVALEVQEFLEKRRWQFCIIGGLAVQHWGEPRLTRDVDMTLLSGFGKEVEYVDALLDQFSARIGNARDFALENRVLLLRSKSGIGIDISLAGLPFEEVLVQRAVAIEMLPGKSLTLCSAEDLIILKAFAARDTDWRDVQSIVARQGSASLDWNYIETNLAPLCELKKEPQILSRLTIIRYETT